MRDQTLGRRRARQLCRSFACVGVQTSPERLRQLAAGADVADEEWTRVNFALIATRLTGEMRVSRYRRLRRRGTHSLIFAGMVLVALNFLVCGAYLLLSLANQSMPW
ncbi:MAG: hypothetical protein JO236_08355 [Mycobacterium sp.]|nr:hypothetical protein [Mycobacterium sp.]